MGYAFTFPIVLLLSSGRVSIGAYVHYPTISTDMLARVRARRGNYANAQRISSSGVLSSAKLLYVHFTTRLCEDAWVSSYERVLSVE